jgi:hypothetical protein
MDNALMTKGKTDNFQLIDSASKLGIPLRKIAFKDQLAHIEPVTGAYIINMQDSFVGEGSHWVAILLEPSSFRDASRNRTAWYFDSYGAPPPNEALAFSKRYGAANLVYSSDQIQPMNQFYCGQYCLDWLYYMTKTKGSFSDRYARFLHQFRTIRQI